MSENELKLQLNKYKLEISRQSVQQQQWHDDFIQREKHWFWQRGFWLIMAGLAGGALITKLFNGFI